MNNSLVWAALVSVASISCGPLAASRNQPLEIIAHRGVHSTYADVGRKGCEAAKTTRLSPYIENTIPSMRAAFAAGASVVEIDIVHSADDEVVVFHDADLRCKTNGTGKVWKRSLAYLRNLDVGFGYTLDGGRTFPLRGKGVGLMPTLADVKRAFPTGRFLLDQKGARSERLTRLLARELSKYPIADRRRFTYWGDTDQYQILHEIAPGVRYMLDRRPMKSCIIRYVAVGWLDVLPDRCTGGDLIVPYRSASLLWGWPERFVGRARRAGVSVYVAWVNSLPALEEVLASPVDGIMTDRIELLGPALRSR